MDGRKTEERALSSSPGRGQSRQNCWDGKMWEDQSESSRERTRGWIWARTRTCKEGRKKRGEGRRSSGAVWKRTKSKGREGSGGWMWRKSFFCARLHKGTLIWHAITEWVQWKRGRTRRAADSQGQWLCNMNEMPHKGCLVQRLLPQTLCCYSPSEMKLEGINCFHWIKKKKKENLKFQLFSWKSSQFRLCAEPFDQNSFICAFLFTRSRSIILDATLVTLFKEAKTDKHTQKKTF